jgi:TetR/AcrR family transcriptional repressor of nem operon
MARPRSFDVDTALDGAMDIFWRQGYTATNLPDLLTAMGLTRGSFYKAFTDKENVYLAALDQYDRKVVDRTVDALANCESPTPTDCIGLLFSGAKDPGRGCFICNAMVELGPIQSEVSDRTNTMASKLRNGIADVLVRYGAGPKPGEPAQSVQEKADLILHLYFGHQAMGKASTGRQDWSLQLTHILGQTSA